MSAAEEISSKMTASPRSLELPGKPFAIGALAALAVLAVAAIGWLVSPHSFGYFTRDPAAITHQAPYMSMVSFFGLFGWAAGATALVCGGYVASLRGANDRRTALFLSAAAVVYLLMDDTFQFHENVFPHYLHLPDSVVEVAYAGVTVVAVIKGRRFFATTNLRVLIAAGILFVISIALDVLVHSERMIFLEDGAKLIGIFTLTAYCVDTALAESRSTFRAFSNPSSKPFAA
jgi:hypothetical protein